MKTLDKPELYVLANLSEDGRQILDYPKGGGSSSPAYIRAFSELDQAKRSRARLMGSSRECSIIRVTGFEVPEGVV